MTRETETLSRAAAARRASPSTPKMPRPARTDSLRQQTSLDWWVRPLREDMLKKPKGPPSRKTVSAMLIVLAAVMVARTALTYSEFSATVDEGIHIAAGVEIYQLDRYAMDLEHPPIARFAIGLPPYLGGARVLAGPPLTIDDSVQGRHILASPADYWKILTLGRIGNLIFVPVLVFYVYLWSAELYGRTAGLVAVVLVTVAPNVLGHAALATIDLAITATLIAAAYHIFHWFRQPSYLRAIAAGSVTGVALMSKYSAIGFLPPILLGFFVLSRWEKLGEKRAWNIRMLMPGAVQSALCFLASAAVVFACFSVNSIPLGSEVERGYEFVNRFLPAGSLANTAASGAVKFTRATVPGFVEGLWEAGNHATRGHPQQFLLGEIRVGEGWWYYFFVALGVKTPLAFLGLLLLALIHSLMRRGHWRRAGGSACVALAAASVLLVGVGSDLNIGIRHILPIFPFLAVLASSLFRDLKAFEGARRWRFLSWGLVGAVVVSSFAAHPDYLAYFNELGRGREQRILADSNLDWGQDLGRLARYVKEHGIDTLQYDCFGAGAMEELGIRDAARLLPPDQPTGWFAVSATPLQGLWRAPNEPGYEWLREHEPVARIGKSIWLYHLSP